MKDITVLDFEHDGKVIFRGSCSPEDKEIERYVIYCFTRFMVPVRSRIVAKRFTWSKGKGLYREPVLVDIQCLA